MLGSWYCNAFRDIMHSVRMFICNVLSKGLKILEINSVEIVRLGRLCKQPTSEMLSCMNCYMKKCFANWPSYGRVRKLGKQLHQHMLLQSFTDASRLMYETRSVCVYIKTHDSSTNRLYIPCRILVKTIRFDVIFGHRHYYSGAIHRLREKTL